MAKTQESQGSSGFEAANNTYVDLVVAGIVDPTSVLLLTEATMTEIPEPEAGAPAEPALRM